MQAQLFKFREHLLHQFNSQLKCLKLDFNKKNIHNLRKLIKKINSLNEITKELGLVSVIDQDQLNNINQLFRSVGKIRETQVQLKILQQFSCQNQIACLPIEKRFRKKRKKHSIKAISILKRLKPINFIQSESSDNNVNFDEQETQKKLLLLIEKKQIEVKQIIQTQLDENILHSIRKSLKTILHTYEFVSNQNNENERSVIEKLNQIQEHLGVWHDHDQLIKKLKKLKNDSANYLPLLETIQIKEMNLESQIYKELEQLNFTESTKNIKV